MATKNCWRRLVFCAVRVVTQENRRLVPAAESRELNASAMARPYLEMSQLLWSYATIIIISEKTLGLYKTEIRMIHGTT
jgi:hypothetical protein